MRHALVVVSSDMVATEPLPEPLRRDDGICVSDSRLLVRYHRPTRDGRIALGKGGAPFASATGSARASTDPPRTPPSSKRACVRCSRSWRTCRWRRAGKGPIDRSLNGLPFITRLGGRADLLACAGYSGNGVGPSYLAGRILAGLVLGREERWGIVGDPPGGFPPEPIRYVGGRVVQAAVRAKERAEDAGRRPGRLAVGIARLAPAGLVPLKRRP